jgi:3-oxoadipate enol-lactonase
MQSYLDVPGGRLFSTIYGSDPAKPWLVLSNCLAADHTMWSGQLGWLGTTHRILLYDTRGHGKSSVPCGRIGFPELVADVVALMDHHGIDRADCMGLSLGGMTGLGVALHSPDRVRRLVCCNARADAPEPFVKMWAGRIAQIKAEGLRSLFSDTLERWVGPAYRQDADGVARLAAMFDRTSERGYVSCAEALQTLDYRRSLPRLAVPALFVAGSDDLAAPPETMREMAQATPGAAIGVIAGARHLSNVDMPAKFRAAVQPFLAAS